MRKYILHASLATLFFSLSLAAQNVDALERQVQEYLRDQKPQLAIPVLQKIVGLDPRNLNAQNNLGVLLFFDNRFSEAVPHLSEALKAQGNSWRIEGLLGIAEKRAGDPDAARGHLEQAFPNIEDQKFRIQTGLELVELYAASARMEDALAVVGKLQASAPRDPQILFVAYQISRQMMDQSLLNLTVASPESAEMHMIMANELGRRGDRAGAIMHYREAIQMKPALPGAHFELAEQLRTSPDPALNAQAEAEYRAALRINPYDELSLRQLGAILFGKGDFKTSEDEYRKALALQPRDSDAETGLAIVLISLDKETEALALLEASIKDDPTNIAAHFRLSNLYRRAGRAADADRELEAFHHFQDVKAKLGQVFRQIAVPSAPR